MIYWLLFFEFFKIGLFAVGGGMVTIPFLFDLTKKYDWFSAAELTDMIAVSQSTPGPVGVNMATYAGFQTAGISGGIIATFGLVLPSVVIVIWLSKLLSHYAENQFVKEIIAHSRNNINLQTCSALFTVWTASPFGTNLSLPIRAVQACRRL